MEQLTLEQRYEIQLGICQNLSKAAIAIKIGKDKSTVYREIKRNSDERNIQYKAILADEKAKLRHQHKAIYISFTEDKKDYVKAKLIEDYSPEQIVGRAKKENLKCVSIETIYQHIWDDKKAGGELYKHLRNKGKRYRKRGQNKDSRGIIANRVDISQRPEIVDKKQRIGDLEIDLIIGAKHNQAILTINDRVTGSLFMSKLPSKEAIHLENKTVELLQDWMPFIHTITSDNGKEFANHQCIAEQLNIDFYFAKPYHSWQRGANENLNGLVRQYFPKKLDFSSITEYQIKDVQNKLNNRPRKRLGYKTPNEVFANLIEKQHGVAFIT